MLPLYKILEKFRIEIFVRDFTMVENVLVPSEVSLRIAGTRYSFIR